MKTHILLVFLLVSSFFPLWGEERVDTLQEVVVTTVRPPEVIPVQRMEGAELERLNSNSVADALRYFSGVQVKDYGGVGGIKTVNVRSMGTNHTGVVYDGVELGNAQNGQIDLGQFSLDNIESLSLHNGQKSELLQPARDFGSAASIYMRTRTPVFKEGKKYNLRATFRTGSFGLVNPSALLEWRLSERINASVSAEWQGATGKYKFRLRKENSAGEIVYDTVATRQNGDIHALRGEFNLNGTYRSGDWHFKVYHYNSRRGVPGAIVNNVWRRGERIGDNNTFLQGRSMTAFGRFSTLNSLKYAYYGTHYVNNDEMQIKVNNRYRQQEIYFSTANEYIIMPFWRAALSYDFQWNTLDADVYSFAKPNRLSNMVSCATSLSAGGVRLQASGLLTMIHDRLEGEDSPRDCRVFTPAVYAFWNVPGTGGALSLRAYFKRSFRMPTFNDLYYAEMGNVSLQPERVTQYDAGVMYQKMFPGVLRDIRVSGDFYINRVKDKIVAYPKGQQFRWTMLNLGEVHITGADVTAQGSISAGSPRGKELLLTLRGQYTFQRAIDVTNPRDSYYRNQIPYIPRHSGSAVLNGDWDGWGLNYSFIYVGERYNQQENIPANYTAAWFTHDFSLTKDLHIRNVGLRISAEVNNLLGQDYVVILNYPMPKRNYRFAVTVTL